jgi:hypothetical protein
MTSEEVSSIRLEKAYFCLNCEVVTNCINICPICGQRQLWPLRNWLGNIIWPRKKGLIKSILAGIEN